MSTSRSQSPNGASNEASLDESHLLSHCPNCDYALTGLPADRNCPECGLSIDRCWRIFGGRSIKHRDYGWFEFGRMATIGVPLISLVWIIILLFVVPLTGPARHILIWTPIGIVALIIALVKFRPKKCIVIARDDLFILKGKKIIDRYDWSHMSRAEHDFFFKSIAFDYQNRRIRLKNFEFFGVNMDEIDRCVTAINRALSEPRS